MTAKTTVSATAAPSPGDREIQDFERQLLHHLKHTIGKDSADATPRDYYLATALTVRDLLVDTWIDSKLGNGKPGQPANW